MHHPADRVRIRRWLAVALLGSVATLGACTSDSAWQAPERSTDELGEPVAADGGSKHGDVHLLFAMNAPSASVTPDGDGYELTLSEPSSVLVFADRPVRQAERITVASFADSWDEMFGDDPPNGALSGLTAEGTTVDVPVELTTISPQGADLGFTMSVLPGVETGPLPDQLSQVSLFIDDTAIVASTFVPFDSSF